jgi:hypothetical protein
MNGFEVMNAACDLNKSGISAIAYQDTSKKYKILKNYSDYNRQRFIEYLNEIVELNQDEFLPICILQRHRSQLSSELQFQSKMTLIKSMSEVRVVLDKLKNGSLMLDTSPTYSGFTYSVELFSKPFPYEFAYKPPALNIPDESKQELNFSSEKGLDSVLDADSRSFEDKLKNPDANTSHISFDNGVSMGSHQQSMQQQSQERPTGRQLIQPYEAESPCQFLVNNTSHGIEGEKCQDISM